MPQEPPHKFFSKHERSAFRTLVCVNSGEWYKLPGPAEWWPDSYNIKDAGFAPEDDQRMVEARIRALRLFTGEKKVSAKDFDKLFWNAEEFLMLRLVIN
jgi:hypothetical protein